MHIHKYEKVWLTFGGAALFVFLLTLGISAFHMGMHPASSMETIDPKKVAETAPFNEPGVKKVDEDTYEVTMIAKAFAYTPNEIQVPVGKKVIFRVTSQDVVHSFTIVDTNVNMMVVPGNISEKEYTFKEPGNYLIICNEYCGAGHHYMKTEIEVVQ
ncbi:cytochrome c oxidase subunit II [Bacillus taeanensis]|uniref:Cytochrome aa3 subunit 2 n=1 Tax=Bacillus taeanensis TaxID=273032 RepID=A0A366XSP2_9BACI|nr:cytochrome c oxidase subunit II [Bacillus taeanensis]RBW68165.1 cytochrome B5 [Bacillus taeanensis]